MVIFSDRRFWLAAALYAALASFFLPLYLTQLDPDGISYILLAQKYSRGDFSNALNATWQPLFPLLLAPLLMTGLDPLWAANLLLVCSGILTLASARLLSLRLPIGDETADVLLFVLVPIVLQFTFVLVSPDLLLTAIILSYFAVVADPSYPSGKKPLLAGALAGLAFLAKAYALPFFLAHFTLVSLFHGWRQGRWQRNCTGLITGLGVFLIIVLAWSSLVSFKYGRFTVSTAMGFNASAAMAGGSSVPPGFFAPPNNSAVSVWEDPGFIRFPPGKFPMMSLPERVARIVLKNTKDAVGILIRFSPLSLAVLLLGITVFLSRASMRRDPVSPILFFSAVVYIAGYLPVNVEVRYIWPALVVLVILAFVCVARIISRTGAGVFRKDALLLLSAASFIAFPVNKLQFDVPRNAWELQKTRALLAERGIQGRIASNGCWIESLYLAFFLKSSYYGSKKDGMDEADVRKQLSAFGVDYYFVWPIEPVPGFLKDRRPAAADEGSGLKVFSVHGE